MAFYTQDIPFHQGEEQMARLMKVPAQDNPTVPALSPQLSNHLQVAPLISIGTLDSQNRPWVTLFGGEKGMAKPLGGGIVGIKTAVTGRYDPVIEELVGREATGQIVRAEGNGPMVSGLTIDLETRKRVKLFGRMIAGCLSSRDDEVTGHKDHIAEIQLVLRIEQSLGNCPKYLNKWHMHPSVSKPELVCDMPRLPQQAIDIIMKSDLFFVASAQPGHDMDTNHRGGPAGFLRVASNDDSGAVLYWPEYSGNRLYQTLGNLLINPAVGICVPDFETGDMVYITGTSEVLVGKDAAAVLPRSNLCVKVKVVAARFVSHALPYRGVRGESSPYNPIVRYLASEKTPLKVEGQELQQATLLSQTKLTPTISRFKFSLENTASYKAGQYVTFDLANHLDIGYSHMRNDDPRSLNDDFVRTFTVSSPPGLKDDEFEITIRKVGVATDFLFKHQGASDRMRLEVGIKGFGGEFQIQQDGKESICFIAAGVGITPLIPSLSTLDLTRLKLLWTVRQEDIGLVLDLLRQNPTLGSSLVLFITNAAKDSTDDILLLRHFSATIHLRRLGQTDAEFGDKISKYYLCTGVPMRKQLEQWLPGKDLVFEDFNF